MAARHSRSPGRRRCARLSWKRARNTAGRSARQLELERVLRRPTRTGPASASPGRPGTCGPTAASASAGGRARRSPARPGPPWLPGRPVRPCSTRSTVARLSPAWEAMSLTRWGRRARAMGWTFHEAFLRHSDALCASLRPSVTGKTDPTPRPTPEEPRDHLTCCTRPRRRAAADRRLRPRRVRHDRRADHRAVRTSRWPPTWSTTCSSTTPTACARPGARDEEAVAAELVRALTDGPGVVAIQGRLPRHRRWSTG